MKQSENIKLNRLLKKTTVPLSSELDKIIGFYRTVLELERIKEPDIDQCYPYPLHFKDNDSDVMLIDLPCNMDFTKAFLDNKNKTFPKDLYVGLPIIRQDKPGQLIIFSLTVDYNDLNGYDPYENLLPVRISNLSLDSRHIDELELTEDQVQEIEDKINQVKDISELLALVKQYIGDNSELANELQLGLSSKNIALAQIIAELNKLNSYMVERNDLLKHFLTHSTFDNMIDNISVDELIQVTSLDESQASVVAHALSNRFSVVTGAPGTGKTQVILNIIANALMKDKSVLVASKINKAVDNVKERFDIIDPSEYLLRFGKRDQIKTLTLPAISKIVNNLPVHTPHDDSLSNLLAQYRSLILRIKDAKQKLARIDELYVILSNLMNEISIINSRINNENQYFVSNIASINNSYLDVSHLENISPDAIAETMSNITMLRNDLHGKYSGFFSLWHNLFSKKKDAAILLNYIEALPFSIKTELSHRNLYRSPEHFKKGKDIIEYSNQVIPLLARIIDYNLALKKEKTRHENAISFLTSQLTSLNNQYNTHEQELETLTANKGGYIHSIHQSKAALTYLAPQIVAAKISEIKSDQNASIKIHGYEYYLPYNIPWKKEDIPYFIQRCREFLSVCRLISVTSLSVKAGFPLTDNLFDILIIDEASQCDVASAIPLILRAKQVIIIGDPKQLNHITRVKSEEENSIREHFGLTSRPYLKYVDESLWDYAKGFLAHANQNSMPVILENHYRCHHDIIGYSNYHFYGGFLPKPLNVKTDESKMSFPQKGMVMINVHGKQESDNININRIEADRAIAIAKEVFSLKAGVSIGIVTPFRNQADYIKSRLPDSLKGSVEVNTAYGFQGDEKDVIIYSLVVTDNSPRRKIYWIDSTPNLVNVAVTRARQTLYIVGNSDYIKAASPERNALGCLIRYALSKTK